MKFAALLSSIVLAACGTKATTSSTTTGSGGSSTSTPTTSGGISNAIGQAVGLTCEQAAKDVPGSEGSKWYMRCPACDELTGTVWGTDLYTDDSNICAAAVHAGRLTKAGGTVLVTWTPGEATYIGSSRNGIETRDYGSWGRSFYVQSVDTSGNPTSPAVEPTPKGTVKLTCSMSTDILGATSGASVHVICPPGCTDGSVWGTDVYTGDSVICVAAVHAGVVSAAAGGNATVTLGGAKNSFTGSERNGVTTKSYEHFDTSFTLAK